MTNLYDIIYNWFNGTLLKGTSLDSFTMEIMNQTISMKVWLSHTGTIIILALLCVFLFGCVRYLFKMGADLFKW